MSIKDLAVQAATAKAQYEQDQAKIKAETQRINYERRSREFVKEALGVEPDEVISSSNEHKNYVRVEDMWFAVGSQGYYMSPRPDDYDRVALIPMLRCQDDPNEFHTIELFSSWESPVHSLEELGVLLRRNPVEKWRVSYYSKCGCPKR